MANINIELSDEIYKKIKLSAIMQDMTVKDHIIKKIDDGLRRRNQ